ncbi:hypothetical protein, partial [Acetobacter tropicalis]
MLVIPVKNLHQPLPPSIKTQEVGSGTLTQDRDKVARCHPGKEKQSEKECPASSHWRDRKVS